MTTRSKRQSGFSLLELLIAMAIMLVIAAIAIPSYQAAQRRAKEQAALEHVQLISKSIVHYEEEFGPAASAANLIPASAMTTLGGSDTVGCAPTATLACLIPTTLATDPNYAFAVNVAANGSTWSVTAISATLPDSYCEDQTGVAKYAATGGTPAVVAGGTTGCTAGTVVGQ